MATLDVAVKGAPATLYAPLLVARYLERSTLLPVAATNLQQGASFPDKSVISLKLANGETFTDDNIVFYGRKLVGEQQQVPGVDEWAERSKTFANAKSKEFRPALDELDKHLALRSYMIGYSLTLADVAVWATIRGNHVAASMLKQANNNITRWFKYIENAYPWIAETIQQLSATAVKEKEGASFEIEVSTKGPLVTRFPPEPSGYLHIGHAKAMLLNEYFAHREKGGKLICRFDDTNPSKESMEFHDAILYDLKLLGVIPDATSYSSDYFQVMYDYAIQLIKDGKAFADDSELGKGDEDRKNRLPSKRRDLSVEDTLRWFEEMKTGSEEGRRWCLRARIAYDSPNGTMRDPVIYRCNATPHHRTGTQWHIYPTYDFCAPILDSVEGVTLALRTNEYRDRNVQYQWFQNALGIRPVEIWDFSRMNFVRTLLSKRKLTRIVDEGRVWGWDDPRMPTVRGMIRRGMAVEALREFMLAQGPSRNILNLEWGALWALNKKYHDPVAPRFTAIAMADAVRCKVTGPGAPTEETVAEKPKHAKNMDVGMKNVIYTDTIVLEQADAQAVEIGEEVTLMNWGNAIVRNKQTKDNGIVSDLTFELHLEGDFKKTKKKLTWLAAVERNLIPVTLYEFDLLITKDKLEKDDVLEDFLTPVTEFKTVAYADCNIADLPKGSVLQFDRKGFFKMDDCEQAPPGSTGPVFFNIPTGRA